MTGEVGTRTGSKRGEAIVTCSKAERKAERDHKIQIKQVEKGPSCKADVEMGLEHVLSMSNTRKKEILRVHFRIVAGVHNMNLTMTTAEFRKLMIMEDVAVEEIVVVGGGG
jgi:hypothetical protein